MTKEMYEDLLKRKQLQIDEYWELIEEQDKHIVELQEQIGKMRCCENCKHHEIEEYTCNIICGIEGCDHKSKWELSE